MFRRAAFSLGQATLLAFATALSSAQNTSATPPPASLKAPPSIPARKSVTFDGLVDAAIRQEQRLTVLMRNFKPIVETYIQEENRDPERPAPKSDDYFLSRLSLTGDAVNDQEFASPDHSGPGGEKNLPRNSEPFAAESFVQAVFPDLDHFDRTNYTFSFVRWEILGDVRCAVVDVKPRAEATNRGFLGRIWIDELDFNIVRFTGTYTAKAFARRTFHFDSWRLNTLGAMWMPAYVYSEESDPRRHALWFKAQTRIWGYDLAHAGDHREFAKPLTDTPKWVDPNRHEASQDLNPDYTIGKTTYTAEDNLVERLQVAGLMAPDGDVDHILETVVNNLLITNDLDAAGIRCRVLLTTPLESFVVGRTIILSRGLLDVIPDEATLAAVLAHELAHIVLHHSLGAEFLSGLTSPLPDLEIFAKLNFRFDARREAAADKKGLELFSKSPYQDQIAYVAFFRQALEASSARLPNLLHGRFSNDFESTHLVGVHELANSPKNLQIDPPDPVRALPLGSRIKVDPWSDRIEMLKPQPLRSLSASEKRQMPFEVSPFFPHLKRLDNQKSQATMPR